MQNLFEQAKNYHFFKRVEVSDLLFTEYKCLEDQSVFDVWSQLNYFVFVLQGKKQWITQSKKYMVYTGECIFVKKGANTIHKFFEEDFCAILIFLPDSFIRNIIHKHPGEIKPVKQEHTDSVIKLNLDKSIDSHINSLGTYFLDNKNPSPKILELKFQELILQLICSGSNPEICSHFKQLSQESKPDIHEIMESNFQYNLSISEFARLSGRSLTVFKNDFKRHFNTSPGKWLTKRRLEYAGNLLKTLDIPVGELALKSGFESTSHFIRSFKSEYGQTPLSYKKALNPDFDF